MSSNFIGLLIILLSVLTSVNMIMAMRNEPALLAWLNQILIGTILISLVSYLVTAFGTRKAGKRETEREKEHA